MVVEPGSVCCVEIEIETMASSPVYPRDLSNDYCVSFCSLGQNIHAYMERGDPKRSIGNEPEQLLGYNKNNKPSR